jgi:crotonobetainyl-CoA:carnitine CoA-transferase CaiB-like acyl-CoA transferase
VSRGKTNRQEDDSRVLINKEGEMKMCANMTDFEKLVEAIQLKKADEEKLKKKIKAMEEELKSYMKKRQKEELLSKVTGLTVSYKAVETPKFNKDMFIKANGEEDYQKYLVAGKSMRLNYLKPKKA